MGNAVNTRLSGGGQGNLSFSQRFIIRNQTISQKIRFG